jgi:hypothetical protein
MFNTTYKYVCMQMWRRNNDIKVDRLRLVNVRLRIEGQSVAILVDSGPKLTAVNCEHDISHPLCLNKILLN